MVSLSLTISISRRPSSSSQIPISSSEPQYTTSLTRHSRSRTSSLCPSYAASLAPTYKSLTSTRPESLERLLSTNTRGSGSRKQVSVVQLENGRLKRRIISMENGHEMERKKSYGIGGAGNIRRPSDVIYPVRTNADGTRRRSSVWSSITTPTGTSPEGKKGGFWGLFRRGSVNEDLVKDDGEVDSEMVAVVRE